MDNGYYSNRISELEKRKIDVSSRIYADKLTLKAINSEIAKCEDEMQHLGENLQDKLKTKENLIESLTEKLSMKNNEIESLKSQINNLNVKLNESEQEKIIKSLEQKLNNKNNLIKQLRTENKELFNQLNRYEEEIENYELFIEVFNKSDNKKFKCSENNIFKKIVESNEK